jgi:hypothetical protein
VVGSDINTVEPSGSVITVLIKGIALQCAECVLGLLYHTAT